ncbi:hypothetical protein F4780DRAFT_446333 [Xylariomycetidae sp. FL0641]|nr:hypothetical protein F4780DRAFT_446333 [Xylariomycetidae sp. FL0641]
MADTAGSPTAGSSSVATERPDSGASPSTVMCLKHCTMPVLPGRKWCVRCKEYAATHRQKKADRGLCNKCLRPRMSGYKTCDLHLSLQRESSRSCSRQHNERQGNARRIRQANGLCAWCTKPSAPGDSKCQKHRDSTRRLYLERRIDGVCNRCKSPSVSGMSLCQRHRDMILAAARQRRIRTKLAAGKCIEPRCLASRVPEKSYCAGHLVCHEPEEDGTSPRDVSWPRSQYGTKDRTHSLSRCSIRFVLDDSVTESSLGDSTAYESA